jgi:hypothetical protein
VAEDPPIEPPRDELSLKPQNEEEEEHIMMPDDEGDQDNGEQDVDDDPQNDDAVECEIVFPKEISFCDRFYSMNKSFYGEEDQVKDGTVEQKIKRKKLKDTRDKNQPTIHSFFSLSKDKK